MAEGDRHPLLTGSIAVSGLSLSLYLCRPPVSRPSRLLASDRPSVCLCRSPFRKKLPMFACLFLSLVTHYTAHHPSHHLRKYTQTRKQLWGCLLPPTEVTGRRRAPAKQPLPCSASDWGASSSSFSETLRRPRWKEQHFHGSSIPNAVINLQQTRPRHSWTDVLPMFYALLFFPPPPFRSFNLHGEFYISQ